VRAVVVGAEADTASALAGCSGRASFGFLAPKSMSAAAAWCRTVKASYCTVEPELPPASELHQLALPRYTRHLGAARESLKSAWARGVRCDRPW